MSPEIVLFMAAAITLFAIAFILETRRLLRNRRKSSLHRMARIGALYGADKVVPVYFEPSTNRIFLQERHGIFRLVEPDEPTYQIIKTYLEYRRQGMI